MVIFLIPLISSCLLEETTNRGSFIHKNPIKPGPIQSKHPEGINIFNYCICQEGNNLTDQQNCQSYCETNNSPEVKVFIKVGLGGETEKKFKNLYNFCSQDVDEKKQNCHGIIRETNSPNMIKLEEDQMDISESEDGNNLIFTYDNENFPKSFQFSIEESNSGIKSKEMLLSILTSDGVVSNTVNVYQYQCIERFVHLDEVTGKYFYSFPQIDYFQFSDLNKKPYVKTNENNRLIICQNNHDATFINDPNQLNKLKLLIDDSSDESIHFLVETHMNYDAISC